MKTLINQLRHLNLSNSVIEAQTGFDKVQLKAYNAHPEEYPIMTGKLKKLLKVRRADKYARIRLNMVPETSQNAQKSLRSHDHAEVKDNMLRKSWNAVKRLFSRKVV